MQAITTRESFARGKVFITINMAGLQLEAPYIAQRRNWRTT